MTKTESCYFFGVGVKQPIKVPTDLKRHLPAERRHHYRDGYSMAEAAKCWMASRGRLPLRIAEVIGGDDLETAHFEYGLKVWGGGTSMTDIMAFIPDAVIAVEAKALESLDEQVCCWMYKGAPRNPRSAVHRQHVIARYAKSFGVSTDALLPVRYQLLHRTLMAARVALQHNRSRAWMIVHSFAPLDCEEHGRNRADFDRYVSLIGTAPVLEGITVRLAWVDETHLTSTTK